MKTGYFLDNSFNTMDTDEYDYVFTGPPCYEDFEYLGVSLKDPISYKTKLLDPWVPRLHPRSGLCTIAFTANRKHNSQIYPKFVYLCETFFENDYVLRDVKYVKKKDTYDGYSSTIIHVYTFLKNGMKGVFNLRKNKLFETYGKECWGPFKNDVKALPEHHHHGLAMPIEVPTYCIQNFTNPGDVVYDQFCGLGTTLWAAKRLGRQYLGYEIREDVYNEGKKILEKEQVNSFYE